MRYFVAYTYETKNATGTGNIELILKNPISNMNIVEEMQKVISEKAGFEKIALINWIKFEEQ